MVSICNIIPNPEVSNLYLCIFSRPNIYFSLSLLFSHFFHHRLFFTTSPWFSRLPEPSMILNLSSFGHILGSFDKKNMDLNMENRPFSPEIQVAYKSFERKLTKIKLLQNNSKNVQCYLIKHQKWTKRGKNGFKNFCSADISC